MTHPLPQDAPARIKALAIKQDSDPAVKLRHLIQCRAYPGARWTERCLELVDAIDGPESARIFELEKLVEEMLSTFWREGHPGEPCHASGWVRNETIARWRVTLRGWLVSGDPSQTDT